ncbi:hypothetical protein [Legionella yabuuchiae]|uniref:hypothetical protein n=1 Tax=Legionella yabuuchiae TaxID=376727 RepID=UPI001055F664|nr:hypothetical protein [Legionella yabuuchiae]
MVQEISFFMLLFLIFAGVGLAFTYIFILTRFFQELREKEPETWERIGRPTLENMLFLPFINFHKFYAFFSVLKARRESDYKYARKAYMLLIIGLMYVLLLVFVMLILILSIAMS